MQGRSGTVQVLWHLRTALAALDRMAPDRARRYGVLRSLGQVCSALADYRGSGEAWLAAAALARQLGDPDRLFATVVGYGYVVRVDGVVQLVRMLDDVLALAGPDDSAVRASALGRRAVPALSNGGLRSTSGDRKMVEAAVAMAERTGDRSAVAATVRSRLPLLGRSGDAVGMLRDAETLVAAGPVGGVTITRDTAASLRDYAAALLRVGRRSDAERQIGLAQAEAGRNGLRMAMGTALIFESALATASGRFGDGKRLAARAVSESQPDNVVTQLVYAGQILAARLEQGRLTEVIDGLRRLQGFGLVAPAWSAMLATALADNGDRAEATSVLAGLDDSFERGPDDFAAPMTLRHLVESCRLLGDQQRARVLLPHAEAGRDRCSSCRTGRRSRAHPTAPSATCSRSSEGSTKPTTPTSGAQPWSARWTSRLSSPAPCTGKPARFSSVTVPAVTIGQRRCSNRRSRSPSTSACRC